MGNRACRAVAVLVKAHQSGFSASSRHRVIAVRIHGNRSVESRMSAGQYTSGLEASLFLSHQAFSQSFAYDSSRAQ